MRAISRFVVVAVLVAFGAAACGSSGSKGAVGTATTKPSGSTSSTAPGSPGATPTTKKLTGNSGSDFCGLARSQESAFKGTSPAAAPTDLKKTFQNLLPALQHIVDIAPSAIKGDFQTFVTAYTPYVKALQAAGYDFSKINYASLQSLSSPDVKAASDHIQQYLSQVCGVTTPST